MPELNQSIASIPLPDRMRSRPISSRGFPVPWFVTVQDAEGEWDFRMVDPRRVAEAHNTKRCWLCGKPLGKFLAFTIGPMCAVNRISSEPPAHRACAEYAVKACPFLSHPRARRNGVDMPAEKNVPGLMLARNPGVALVWLTDSYRAERTPEVAALGAHAGVLFAVGDPLPGTSFWCEGRAATHAEVEASVAGGLPALAAAAALQGAEAEAELARQVERARPILLGQGAAS